METSLLIYSIALLGAIYLLYKAAKNHQAIVMYRWLIEMRIEQRKQTKIRKKEEQKRKLEEAKQAIEKTRQELNAGGKKSFGTPGTAPAGPPASSQPAPTAPKK